ncbi:MAG: imidazole glycerol phosphate synthase subunit HisH [Actinomycetota bacterium]
MKRVVVLDYGIGNVHSALKALERAGAEVSLTAAKEEVLSADGLVVPGVGAFATVMAGLNRVAAPELIDRRLAGGKKVLGICVGLQVMFEKGFEHGIETEGLGQWPGQVEKLVSPKLPHMGWNSVTVGENSTIFRGIENELFYFVHSYAAKSFPLDVQPPFMAPALTMAEYGERFIAAVENGPLSGVQFHPEKSGEAGIQLLRNWIESL